MPTLTQGSSVSSDLRRWIRRLALLTLLAMVGATALLAAQLPALAADGLLIPARHKAGGPAPTGCVDATFDGVDVTLSAWRCRPPGPTRGTVIYLHGVSDNRSSVLGVRERFTMRGFEVIAYDSRAHGESSGEVCTYGFYEKDDLRRVIDAVGTGPIVLMGTSLGAAVALQAASGDARVSAVVAVETFSDLRTIAQERAPFFLTRSAVDRAFEMAESRGQFRVAAVSPVLAAGRIEAPVLLIHGALDSATPPNHSRRVLAALGPSAQLILVGGAGHNQSLSTPDIWPRIETWLERALSSHS